MINLPPPSHFKRLVILTGAGISTASGLATWRGSTAIANASELQTLCSHETLMQDPQAVWRFFGAMRSQIQTAMPNQAHIALAQLEASITRENGFLLVTQNIDGLHQRAGSQDVVEYHGNIHTTRCSNSACDFTPFHDIAPHNEQVPLCPLCKHVLRPDVVLFGEQIPAFADWKSKRALRDCDLLLVIGSSGHVNPAANFVRSARYAGAHTVLLNLDPAKQALQFDQVIHERAEEWLPQWLAMA